MALIKCPKCTKEISDKSKACIHCGYVLENCQDEIAPEQYNEKELEREEKISNEKKEIQAIRNRNNKKLVLVAIVVVVVIAIGVLIISLIKGQNEKARVLEIQNSLSGKTFIAIVDDWGYRYDTYNTDGTVNSTSYENDGSKNADYKYVYGVKEIEEGIFAIDHALDEDTLFYEGEYEYIVTEIEGTQIVQYEETDEFAGIDVYVLDTDN